MNSEVCHDEYFEEHRMAISVVKMIVELKKAFRLGRYGLEGVSDEVVGDSFTYHVCSWKRSSLKVNVIL